MEMELSILIDDSAERFSKIVKQTNYFKVQEKERLIYEALVKHLQLTQEIQKYIKKLNPPEKSILDRFAFNTIYKHHTNLNNSISTYNEPFSLFVVGNGNYGKSTLINSLMGEMVAETNILPKTWKLDFFRSDLFTNQVIIKYRDLKTKKVSIEEAHRLIETEENLRKESEKKIKDLLSEFKKSKPDRLAIKDKEKELQINYLYYSPMIEVHWPVKKNLFSSTFYIVDTPGLNQKLDGVVKSSIKDYYHKADGVIWLLDATVISAKNSSKLLEEIQDTINTVGESKGELIAVLNRIDLIPTLEQQQTVIDEANRLLGDYFSSIIPYSSKLAFEGKRDKDLEKLNKSHSMILEEQLYSRYSKNRSLQKLKSKEFALSSHNKFLLTDIAEFQTEFNKYRQEVDEDYKSFKEEIKLLEKDMDKKMRDYGNSTKQSIRGNIYSDGDSFFEIQDEKKRDEFLRDVLFDVKKVEKDINFLKEGFINQLTLIQKRYLEKVTYTEFKYLNQHENLNDTVIGPTQITIQSANYTINSNEMNVGIGIAAAITAGAILGPVGMLVGGLAGWAYKNFQRGKLIEQLEKQAGRFVDGLTANLRTFVLKNTNEVEISIATKQFQSFSGLYELNYFNNNEMCFKEKSEITEAFKKLDNFEADINTWTKDLKKLDQIKLSNTVDFILAGGKSNGK